MEVTYIDHMGDDIRVVNSARVSFAKESEWEIKQIPTPKGNFTDPEEVLSKRDQKLIKYLATHNHFTPFTHVQITMREKVPIFVARQRFKHTIGFSYNEVSRRYVDDDPEFFLVDVWRLKPEGSIKQGSKGRLPYSFELTEDQLGHYTQDEAFQRLEDIHTFCLEVYNEYISNGIAPEQARMVLPQSMYTEYFVTGSLAAWARAYNLRSDPHAQKEIQELAAMWNKVISGIKELEYSWTALTE